MFKRLFAKRHAPIRNEADVVFETAFNYRSKDVVLASYPKSGSTWLRFMLAALISEDPQQVDFLNVQIRVPELSNTAAHHGVDFDALPDPRLFRSHAPYNPCFPRVVYLLRDPRDVFVSYYHHQRKFAQYTGSLTDYLRSHRGRYNWASHVAGWLDHADDPDRFLIVRYEMLRADPIAELTRVVRYIGLDADEMRIRTAVEISSFENMRRLEDHKGLGYVAGGDPTQRFVRRGKANGWRDELNAENQALVEAMCGNTMRRAGYDTTTNVPKAA